ncbi:ECF transporter S component [Acetilactobacillus jinshanensis]|uniref:Riboflavin transporter n=1 Tax=Acetilactobacillus jinshanensis TaxID=1720083 RepID=A0A4P6ZJ74_9LACO|nr:ECF transporter S component [Acetilactobacillus jinshanensis]QBP17658.1 ECF transporter S component [Acetilactobacillus jinshanensis]URL61800.1 ECF transporter S component [uncultured bacterium]
MPLTVEHLTKIIQVAILAAISYVLTLFAFPVIPIVPYLKLDLSDLPILVGTVVLGISAGASIAGVTTLLHLLMSGLSLPAIIGDSLMFISALTLVLTVGLLISWYRRQPAWSRKLLLIMLLTLNLTVIMAITNLGAIPLYMKIAGMTIQLPVTKLIEFGVVPFNLIKGTVVGILFVFIDRYLQRSKRFQRNY